MNPAATAPCPPPWRVLHVVDSANLGGIQRFLSSMLPAWTDARFEHRIASLHGPGLMHEVFAEAGCEPVYLAGAKASPLIPLRLWRLARRWRPSLIHAHGFASCYLVERMRPVLGPMPCLSHLHITYHPDEPFRASKFYYHKAYRKARFLLACSRGARQSLPVQPSGGARVVYYGVDANRFSPNSDPSDRQRLRHSLGLAAKDCLVGTTGRLVKQKGVSVLLQAMAVLRDRGASLRVLVVGSGPGEKSLRSLSRELGIEDRVIWAGYQDDVVPWLRAMDVFAFPSYTEGLGLSLAEAMACELPCAVSDFTVAPEIVRAGENALMFQRGDAQGLADCIARFANDEQVARRFGKAARRHVVDDLSLESMTANLAKAYEDILTTGRLELTEDTP